jgi:serine/threonine protein kinase
VPDVRGASAVAQDDIRGGLPVGTVLGGYELISILGKGGFGITYRARSLTLNKDVAIKEYLPTALAIREGRTTVLPISTNHAEQFAGAASVSSTKRARLSGSTTLLPLCVSSTSSKPTALRTR